MRTHHRDFAKGFVPLLGNPQLAHVPSDLIAAYDPAWGAGLLGDQAHSVIFDNSKLKRIVPGFAATIPYAQGAREALAWFDADPARQVMDAAMDATMDRILTAYQAAWPK